MNVSEIKEIIELFNTSQIHSLKLEQDNFSLKLDKSQKAKEHVQVQATQVQEVQAIPIQSTKPPAQESKSNQESLPSPANYNAEFITSPMVGTFYRSPSPGAAPYVSIGDTVKKGQTIGIIEAMKIMNEIEAEFDCKIIEIEVNDAQPVEFGTKLVMIERV